jgi:hypothetical protein
MLNPLRQLAYAYHRTGLQSSVSAAISLVSRALRCCANSRTEIGRMADNLLRKTWTSLDSQELRLLLNKRIGGTGQFGRDANPNKFYLPWAREACRVVLTFEDKKIIAVEPGPAFDAAEWTKIAEEIENAVLVGPSKVGREYSFSSHRVPGSWRGVRSGVQILPAIS